MPFSDVPGGPVVKSPPCNARDTGLILGQGAKFPHAMGQLSPQATTSEDYMLQSRAHAPQQGQHSQKNKQTKCLSTAKEFILATVILEAREQSKSIYTQVKTKSHTKDQIPIPPFTGAVELYTSYLPSLCLSSPGGGLQITTTTYVIGLRMY